MSTTPCPSSYHWDQFDTHALSASRREAMSLHLEGCAACQARRTAREESREALLQMPGVHELIAAAEERLAVQPQAAPARWERLGEMVRAWLWPLGGLATAACLWMLLPTDMLQRTTPPRPSAPNKGGFVLDGGTPKSSRPSLRMMHYRQGSRHSLWTQPGEVLHPGDLILFSYRTVRPFYAMIASVNVRGEVSVFVPLNGTHSAHVTSKEGDLPRRSSLELDAYIGPEKILMVTSQHPFSALALKRAVKRALARAGHISRLQQLPGPWAVQMLLIHKKRRPSVPR